MSFTALKCPSCGADIEYDDKRDFMFCQYCGAKVIPDNKKIFVYRNEAKLRKLEIEAEKDKEVKANAPTAFAALLAIVGVLFLLLGILGLDTNGSPAASIAYFIVGALFMIVPPIFVLMFKRK